MAAKGRTASRSGAKARTRGRSREKAPKAALILECDTTKLQRQGISLAQDSLRLLEILAPGVRADLIRVSTLESLRQAFAVAASRRARYDVVFLVGHGSLERFALAQDAVVPWSAVAAWLAPFQPSIILVGSCEGGRWLPAKALLAGITSLKTVYGTPVQSMQTQLSPLPLLLLHLLGGGKVTKDGWLLAQVTAVIAAQAIVLRLTRREVQKTPAIEAAVWTGLEGALRKLLGR